MEIDVYDSFAISRKGYIIHFDVLVEKGTTKNKAFEYGRLWMVEIGENEIGLNQDRCNYCHSKQANKDIQKAILKKGYYILQLEGCPNPIR